MPPVIAIAAGAAVAGLGAAGVGATVAFLGTTLAVTFFGIGVSLVLGGLSQALAKKPNSRILGDAGFRAFTTRAVAAPWRIPYGAVRAGGVITFVHAAGTDNEFIYMVITLAGREISAVNSMYFDGVLVPVDGNGDATGDFAGHAHREINLGADDQAAFPGLLADVSLWTATHRQRGRAGVYVRLKWNPDLYNNGVPNITFDVDGRELYDPRTNKTVTNATNDTPIQITTSAAHGWVTGNKVFIYGVKGNTAANGRWKITVVDGTNFTLDTSVGNGAYTSGGFVGLVSFLKNAALAIVDYLLEPAISMGADYETEVDETRLITAANVCDEAVTLKAGGSEPRYEVNGIFEASDRLGEVLEQMMFAMAGSVTFISGKWQVYAGAWRAPSITLTEADMVEPLRIRSRISRRELFNGVKGTAISPANNWQATDFNAVPGLAFLAEDGNERVWHDVFYGFITSNPTAQRVSKIFLERARRQMTVEIATKLSGYQFAPPDIMQLTNARLGWTAKTFEIINSELGRGEDATGQPFLLVRHTLREADASIYAWSEVTAENAPNVPLSPTHPTIDITLPGVTAVSVSEGPQCHTDKHSVSRITCSFTAPANTGDWQGVKMFVTGYEASPNPVLVAESEVSPFHFGLESTNEGVRFYFVSVGKDGRRKTILTSPSQVVLLDGQASAPATPSGFTGQALQAKGQVVRLSWSENVECDIDHYEIARRQDSNPPGDGDVVATLKATGESASKKTQWEDAPGSSQTNFKYYVRAVNNSNKKSAFTSAADIRALAPDGTKDSAVPTSGSVPTGTYYFIGGITVDSRKQAGALVIDYVAGAAPAPSFNMEGVYNIRFELKTWANTWGSTDLQTKQIEFDFDPLKSQRFVLFWENRFLERCQGFLRNYFGDSSSSTLIAFTAPNLWDLGSMSEDNKPPTTKYDKAVQDYGARKVIGRSTGNLSLTTNSASADVDCDRHFDIINSKGLRIGGTEIISSGQIVKGNVGGLLIRTINSNPRPTLAVDEFVFWYRPSDGKGGFMMYDGTNYWWHRAASGGAVHVEVNP